MPAKPKIISQLSSQTGLGRPGGAMSKASNPSVMNGTGSAFAAMENTLLRGADAGTSPKSLAGGGSGRHFNTLAAGGDLAGAKLPKVLKIRKPKIR